VGHPLHEGDGKAHGAGVREQPAALRQRRARIGNRHAARCGDVFLLQVDQHDSRNGKRIDEGTEMDDIVRRSGRQPAFIHVCNSLYFLIVVRGRARRWRRQAART